MSAGSGPAKAAPRGRQLRDAEREMARLQRERDKITESLTGASDHREMTRLGDELASAQSALEQAEERWLALAEATDVGIQVEGEDEALSPFSLLLSLQLFTYWLAVKRGCNPDLAHRDDPRHLKAATHYEM